LLYLTDDPDVAGADLSLLAASRDASLDEDGADVLYEGDLLDEGAVDEPLEALPVFSLFFVAFASARAWSRFAFACLLQSFSSLPFSASQAFLSALYVSFACLRAALAGSSAPMAPKLAEANAAAIRMLRTLFMLTLLGRTE
jgi:hypothetical protein